MGYIMQSSFCAISACPCLFHNHKFGLEVDLTAMKQIEVLVSKEIAISLEQEEEFLRKCNWWQTVATIYLFLRAFLLSI